jgi:hypothetical protein
MVGGARAATLLLPRQQTVESEAPSTTLLRRVVPLPPLRVGGCKLPRSRARLRPRVLPINNVPNRHCEERSDEAIQNVAAGLDCFASLAMTNK